MGLLQRWRVRRECKRLERESDAAWRKRKAAASKEWRQEEAQRREQLAEAQVIDAIFEKLISLDDRQLERIKRERSASDIWVDTTRGRVSLTDEMVRNEVTRREARKQAELEELWRKKDEEHLQAKEERLREEAFSRAEVLRRRERLEHLARLETEGRPD